MSARDVADMLAVAHAGHAHAVATGDESLRAKTVELAALALAHRDAGTFFTGLSMALAESYRDHQIEEVQEEDDPMSPLADRGDIADGGTTVDAPVDAGAVPHDGRIRGEDLDHADDLEPAVAMVTTRRATACADPRDVMRRAARALR